MSSIRSTVFLGSLCALALLGCPSDSLDERGTSADGGSTDADGGTAPGRDPSKPSKPGKPGKPGQPGDQDEPDQPGGPNDPGDPGDPGDPSDPSDPGDPNDPRDPVEPKPNAAGRMFLPTDGPANTRAPKLVLDRAGNLHAVYPAYAGGDAYYAFCPDGCRDANAMEVMLIPTDGTVNNAMLAVTRSGAPRVLLQTALQLVWAQCDDDCGDARSWQSSVILDHAGKREVSGNALALDANDRPRFVMHTYIALLGIGQDAPQTFYAQCDADCGDQASWRYDAIQDQIWQASQLRFDAAGRAHLATVAVTLNGGAPPARQAAYLACDDGCTSAADWNGIVLMNAYENYAQEINPAIALALSKDGGPRVAVLGKSATGGKNLAYFECDEDCHEDHWRLALISENDGLGSGVDIQVDARDQPRVALTLGHNIGIYHCEGDACAGNDASWNLSKVEFATDLAKDPIILWPNCTSDAWSLHDPSLVLGAGGSALVGYEATDLSGGARTIDPTKPACVAGKDMTLSRLAQVPSYLD